MSDTFVEIIGRVERDSVIKMQACTNMGSDLGQHSALSFENHSTDIQANRYETGGQFSEFHPWPEISIYIQLIF